MRETGKFRQAMTWLLAACLLLPPLPVSALAERDTVTVAAFGLLEETALTVPWGTAEGDLPLPAALEVRLAPEPVGEAEPMLETAAIPEGAQSGAEGPDGKAGTIEGVSWFCPDYDGETPGDYGFTASAPGYVCAQGASWPAVTVTVAPPPETLPLPEAASPPETNAGGGLAAVGAPLEAEALDAGGDISESQTWAGPIADAVTITGGTEADPVVITVQGTVTAGAKITVSSGHVIFTGGGTIQWQSGLSNAFVVEKGASAVLEDITLDGNGKSFSRSALLIYGTATLGMGATVRNFKSSGTGGAGAGAKGVIAAYGGTLNIGDGAVITGNQSGSGIIALYDRDESGKTDSNARVFMTGGTIFGNTVRDLGSTSNMGVIWNWTGALEISGGSVTAEGIEYAVYTQGNHGSNGDYAAHTIINDGSFNGAQTGAVCAGKGDNVDHPASTTTTINGGVFSGNSAAAVRFGIIDVQGGTFNGTRYALDVGTGDIRVSGGSFFGETTAYKGSVSTLTQEVIVGDKADSASAKDWDRSTSLNTYRYVSIGSAYTAPHAYHYSADGAVVTGRCEGCDQQGTATLTIREGTSLTYTGKAIEPATIKYSEDWVGRRDAGITYTDSINAGTATAQATVGGETVSLSFAITQAQNSITGLTCDNVDYGETPIPSGASATFGGDGIQYTYSDSENGTYGPWSTENGAGTWYVKAAVAATANYAGAEEIIRFQVAPAKMTGISAGGCTGTYDGAAHGIAVTGAPDGAAVAYSLTDGSDWSAAQPEIKNVTPAEGTKVYYKVSKLNYADETGSATVTIRPREITAAWEGAASWVYDGEAHAPTAKAETGVDDETVTLAVTGGGTNAGAYTATASISAVTGGQENPANYTLKNDTLGFTVTKAPVSFTVSDDVYNYDAQAKTATVAQTADGTPSAAFTVSYKQNGSGAAAPTAVGEYEIWVTLGSENFKFKGEVESLREKRVGTLTISGASYPNAATMTWPAAGGLTYGAKLSASALTGGSEAGNGSYAWKLPDTIPTVSNAGYTVVFTPKDTNYSPVEGTVPVSVAPKELTITGARAESRVYAPENIAVAVSGGTLNGVVSRDGTTDNVTLNAEAAAGTVETPDGGKARPVIVTGYALGGADAGNYVLKQPDYVTVDITPAQGAGSVAIEGWTYGGAANSPIPASETNGMGDVRYRYTGTKLDGGAYDSEARPADAGTYTVAATFAATDNYEAATATGDFAIAPKPIMAQWAKTSHTYDGAAKSPTLTLVDVEEADQGGVSALLSGGGVTKAGSSAVTAELTGVRAFNYRLTNPTGTLTIQKAPVTFTVTEDAKEYDGQPKTAAVTAMANAAGFTGFTVAYKTSAGGPVLAPTAVGSYEIWAAIDSPNHRHADSTGGESRKIGVFTIYQTTPPAKYTVSFAPGEGDSGSTGALGGALAGTLRVLPACGFTRAGFAFTGWELDGRLYQPGQTVEQPARSLILTARWAPVRTIGGTVTQEDRPVPNAVVTLMRGARYIAETTTDEQGKFYFTGVAPDLYNLVGSRNGVIMTIKAEVSSADMKDAVIELPKDRTNSVVEVLAGTPEVIVGNLEAAISAENPEVYTEADRAVVAGGGAVELKLTAQALEGSKAAEAQAAIGAAQNVGLYLDLSLQKTVATAGGTPTIEITPLPSSGSTPLESVLPLPADLQGKYRYLVYRLHDPDGDGGQAPVVDVLTETPNPNGEYIQVGADKTSLTILAKNYSVYAVAWAGPPSGSTDKPTGGGGAPSAPPPTVVKPEHGTVGMAPSHPAKGETVVLSPKPDQAYRPGTVTITDKAGKELPVTDNGDGTWSYTQPAGGVTITVTFIPDGSGQPAWNPFTDVKDGDWFYDSVKYVYGRGLMKGTGKTTFSPGLSTARGMIVTILWRLEQEPESGAAMAFTDVKAGSYCYEAVRWAAEHEIVKGYTTTTFGPENTITRQELAAILYRYARYKGTDVSAADDLTAFTDHPDPWAEDAVKWAVGEGILTGKGGGVLDPKGQATRAQAAAMLQRLLLSR